MGKLVDDFDINRIADYSKIFTDGGKDRTILMWMIMSFSVIKLPPCFLL